MIHLLVPTLVNLEDAGALSVSVSVCVRRVPSVSVTRITAGTRLAAAAASVSPVLVPRPAAVVTAVNVALYSKEGHAVQ